MREILFRGKRVSNGEWVEGFLLKECNHSTCSWNLGIEYKTKRSGVYAYDVAEIVSETVGQFTGLTDKNGKKIFEGDIIKYFCNDYRPNQYDVHQIFFNDETARFVGKLTINNFTISLYKRNELKYEVIGNIHDNPELLGGNYCG